MTEYDELTVKKNTSAFFSLDAAIARNASLGHGHPKDWPAIVALEERIFESGSPLFQTEDLSRIYNKQPKFMVLSYGTEIQGYLSWLPLSRSALAFCLDRQITSIIRLPERLLECSTLDCRAIFFEVIAFERHVRPEARKPLVSLFYLALDLFSHLPALGCPVTEIGMHIVKKRGFSPVANAGLENLYLRGPTGIQYERRKMD